MHQKKTIIAFYFVVSGCFNLFISLFGCPMVWPKINNTVTHFSSRQQFKIQMLTPNQINAAKSENILFIVFDSLWFIAVLWRLSWTAAKKKQKQQYRHKMTFDLNATHFSFHFCNLFSRGVCYINCQIYSHNLLCKPTIKTCQMDKI